MGKIVPSKQNNCKKETLGIHFSPIVIKINSLATNAKPIIQGKDKKTANRTIFRKI